MVTHRAVERSPVVASRLAGARARVLARREPARPQPGDRRRRPRRCGLRVRPAGDALRARRRAVVARSTGGEREIPVEELIIGHYETSLEPDELIVEVARAGGVDRRRIPQVPLALARGSAVRRACRGAAGSDGCASSSEPSPDGRSSSRRSAGSARSRPRSAALCRGDRAARRRPRLADYRRRVIAVEVRRALEELDDAVTRGRS